LLNVNPISWHIAKALAFAFVRLGGPAVFHFTLEDGLPIEFREQVIVSVKWEFRRETLSKIPEYTGEVQTKWFDK